MHVRVRACVQVQDLRLACKARIDLLLLSSLVLYMHVSLLLLLFFLVRLLPTCMIISFMLWSGLSCTHPAIAVCLRDGQRELVRRLANGGLQSILVVKGVRDRVGN